MVAVGGGDVVVAIQARQADGRAAERGRDAGCVPGPDQGLVFPAGDVADPVELVLYLPVALDPGEKLVRRRLLPEFFEFRDLSNYIVSITMSRPW
jgi:hypothetical protein